MASPIGIFEANKKRSVKSLRKYFYVKGGQTNIYLLILLEFIYPCPGYGINLPFFQRYPGKVNSLPST